MSPRSSRRGHYGVDAPVAPTVFGLALIVFAVLAWMVSLKTGRLAIAPLLTALFFGVQLASYLFTTRRGKFVVWDELLDQIAWRGDERVVDLGCGRGAVLTLVAERLTTGTVTGVDIWKTTDQSGNAMQATKANIELEGVGNRVVLQTGDMRTLSFPDASFDLVVSSLAIHNIDSDEGRAAALAQAVRVLVPGGRLAIADIKYVERYAGELRRLGMEHVVVRSLGWRFWYGNPFVATSLVTATKAAAAGHRPSSLPSSSFPTL